MCAIWQWKNKIIKSTYAQPYVGRWHGNTIGSTRGKKWVQLAEAMGRVGHLNCQKLYVIKRNACKDINQSHVYNVVHNVILKKKTITISPPMAKPISSLVNVTEYLSKKHEVISSETIVAIPVILQVTFPVQVILRAVDLKSNHHLPAS